MSASTVLGHRAARAAWPTGRRSELRHPGVLVRKARSPLSREQPSYLRIVEDIRRRIASGDLRPGEPVPSARRITQDWGVALATATRALATLSAEGLTRSVPGVATVVAPAPSTGVAGRARRGDVELNRNRIVASAVEIADAEGLAH